MRKANDYDNEMSEITDPLVPPRGTKHKQFTR